MTGFRPPLGRGRLALLVVLGTVFVSFILLASRTRLDIGGRGEGLFLLRGNDGELFELKDDLFLGDGSRYIVGFDTEWIREILRGAYRHGPDDTWLDFDWSDAEGNGYVKSHFPGGKVLFTSFSRYKDNDGLATHGLFVGGGIPRSLFPDSPAHLNDTGMAFHDGKRWTHLWCNTNEGIGSGTNPHHRYAPSAWKFLGSRVLNRSGGKVTLASAHEVDVDGVPLRVEKFAYFTAGQTYFKLGIVVTNTGVQPASYFYMYGDEPWLGTYGTSEGNVGWVWDRIIEYEERIDPRKYSYAGMFEYGNAVIGERHIYPPSANFIEWLGPDRPDVVLISNRCGEIDHADALKVPLAGDTRSISVQWGPRTIRPGETRMMFLAIGMAHIDATTGFPFKPEVKLHSLTW